VEFRIGEVSSKSAEPFSKLLSTKVRSTRTPQSSVCMPTTIRMELSSAGSAAALARNKVPSFVH
jgi:hypothetical protein